ncbi:MAG: OB-fold nucleic acid binding domain-containing protein, partial [Candidatus Muiribacteriaceae bacterium]
MYNFPEKDIQYIKGVGPKRVHLLNKLGIESLEHLFLYAPFRYEDRREAKLLKQCQEENDVLVEIFIEDRVRMKRNGLEIIRYRGRDRSSRVTLTFFNQRFVFDKIVPGKTYYFFGRLKKDIYGYSINSPQFSDSLEGFSGIIPVYELTKGLTLNVFRKIVRNALKSLEKMEYEEILPDRIVKKYNIEDLFTSIANIHFPDNSEDIERSVYCLKFREIFLMSCAFQYLRGIRSFEKGITLRTQNVKKRYLDLLPFTLTSDQRKAVDQMENELEKGK